MRSPVTPHQHRIDHGVRCDRYLIDGSAAGGMGVFELRPFHRNIERAPQQAKRERECV